MKRLCLVFVLLLLPAVAFAESFPIIERQIFGLKLGESSAALLEKSKTEKFSVTTNQWSFTDEDNPMKIWGIDGAINKNEAVKETRLYIYNGQVSLIRLYFKDHSLDNFKVLKGSLEKKYGENKKNKGFMNTLESKASFNTTFDGKPVTIMINHDIDFTEGGVLYISYAHDKIMAAGVEEFNQRKAKKVEGDL